MENIAAATMPLPPQLVAAVGALLDGSIAGARYSSKLQAQIDTEVFPDEGLD